MRSSELVKLNSDTNYIPQKWQVVEATITSGGGNVWLKCVAHGVDTEENLKKIFNEYYYDRFDLETDGRARSVIQREGMQGLVGTMDEYRIETISNISAYSRPSFEGFGQKPIG